MQRRSPPKHRHDGTSPLPLGMDWSPPPRKWNGRDTVWPHDHHTGWSYCVMIPSWVILPKARNSDPIVFYRVQVGVQSPEGITTSRGILRRFNDFLKLFSDLKKEFPKKSLPPAPPKGLLRMKSRVMLEERRHSLEDWMTKLLSDIDISRSVSVASFLELEASARSSFQGANNDNVETSHATTSSVSSIQSPSHPNLPLIAGNSSITSEYGSDTPCETSEIGTPVLGRDDNSESGIDELALDEDMINPMEKLVEYGISNVDEGLFMGQTILDQLEGFPRNKMNVMSGNRTYNGNSSQASLSAKNMMVLPSEPQHGKIMNHVRKLSNGSVASDESSLRGSDLSYSGIPNPCGGFSLDAVGGNEIPSTAGNRSSSHLQPSDNAQLVLPFDQRYKLNRILLLMQRRLVTAKTDMEDLIVRLNQEIAAKDYLTTKVKDLEVELETTKQRSKENLQQAILIERERFTKMQWDMEELRQKSLEMDLKMKLEIDGKLSQNCTKGWSVSENDVLLQELNSTKEQLHTLSKRYEELETNSKADIKVLVKEVKSLRSSQKELKEELNQSTKEKLETESLLQHEKEIRKHSRTAWKKLLQKYWTLQNELQDCNINFETEQREILNYSSVSDANQLTAADERIGSLLREVENFTEDEDFFAVVEGSTDDTGEDVAGNEDVAGEDGFRKLIAHLLLDNARLRKELNSSSRHAHKLDSISGNERGPPTNNTQ